MLFRRSSSKRNSKKVTTRARRHPARLCRVEPLEQRRLLAAFDIDGYTQIGTDIELDDLGPDFRDYSGVAYSDVTDSIFIVDNRNNLGAPIFAYVTDDKTDAFTLFVENDSPNNMVLYVNNVAKTLASVTRNAAYALSA